MAIAIKVSTDTAALGRKLDQSVKRYPRAAAAGINRAAQGAFTLSVRAIQADVGAGAQKTIRRNLSLQKATAEKPEARLIAFSSSKDRIPIYEMNPRPKTVTRRRPPGGVRYGKQGILIPGSFIAVMKLKSGHVGVFRRLTAKRFPIVELKGPSVALVFSRKKIQEQISEYLRTKVPEEIARAFKFVTG
jgi:hypothetical protein